MASTKSFVTDFMEKYRSRFEEISTHVWNHPETRFQEYESAAFLANALETEGFAVERNVAGIETAFIGTFGEGAPYIGFLGEFDALSGLSQQANIAEQKPIVEGGIGHGCGHNLLGTGALSSAFAVKAYMEEHNLPGTVQFFGCPGEEGGSGKTFMAREGVFDHLDVALSWHPSPVNSIMHLSTLANYQVYFRFKGITSHAANSPHLGRSALDAVELMNVGVNYLREHVPADARMHYAVTNTGGYSPNVVQADAEVLYLIRAPKVEQVDEIYKRVCKVAEGAALMTETQLTITFDKACSNYEPNRALEKILHRCLVETGAGSASEEDQQFAKAIWESLNEGEQKSAVEVLKGFGYTGDGSEFEGKYLYDDVSEYIPSDEVLSGSTDVSDVSWLVPTAQCTTATAALGTPLHTWQMVTQGISPFAHSGMLRAGTAMALTAIHLLENTDELKAIKEEHEKKREKNPYVCPIPAEVKPSVIKN
ncbi:M20 family metallopeptidase [Planomicrobium sp. CPCC 101110]|uniref:M20 family metallopeptidase n=1 Tax=Planomicrobium sp. CPCC 101110 TaxID=2599619 RepID=UPI0011B58EE4|nr:M20 family metallopeptidase [Planomicrobium sp. CPCC 101110]TWT24811.1 amidohydrolase [Planomicrobium sp. CPCC 101110]